MPLHQNEYAHPRCSLAQAWPSLQQGGGGGGEILHAYFTLSHLNMTHREEACVTDQA